MNIDNCILLPLSETTAMEISMWEYEKPYDIYSFKGRSNAYLMKKKTWGVEQFALCCENITIAQVACQFDNNSLWVGWSLSPKLCGKGNGFLYIKKMVQEIRKTINYTDTIYLRVAAKNKRAIKAYQKAGFQYKETIQDEVAYTNITEDFWVMTEQE